MTDRYFSKESFEFLSNLASNNERDWFKQHKQEYEDAVRTPALNFITDMQNELAMISPHFLAIPRKVGGSLMRVHRDVRFGKDKRPYKTNVGIQFRHERGKDVHAPGFYVHIEPGECFVGVGVWRPDSPSLGKIRDAIVEKSNKWKKASANVSFKKKFEHAGDSLTNPPRGYPKDHPLLADLKRKDFIAISKLSDQSVNTERFRKQVLERFHIAAPYMQFLCNALELRY